MRKIIWSARAVADLEEIHRFIAADNLSAASRLAARILEVGDSLADFPHRGRTMPQGLRQISTVYPYLIRYRVHRGRVEILSVRHGARDATSDG